ncbi:hypothetical protein FVEN_g3753 [Fusarium venenatum]|uniref:Arrestin-like N-terminal domain-containing protein n=1 Tax=Fusarium venenatum TaxID=56646 RepID=A0A2L2SY11_9HYPO|nr:uncharacterized protein FVRRES_13726 [Fusarium venenatum]KAG8358539.1 hypothetical protein FVEN_g3753 [Fusarium venenatum]KAH6980237.1 hypothetical protein EDB82DRAFT_568689 [Fusarium venenatum]CEI41755.1 unnamed protein product [Fusarium venenatum]
MEPLELKSDQWLGIHLDSDTYAPGDTITGYVYRERSISTPDAIISCCLHGGAKVIFDRDARDVSQFSLLACRGEPDIIHRGPLHIRKRTSQQWPFSLNVPTYADSTLNTGNTSTACTPVGATDHQLPPTYQLSLDNVVNIFVEYFVVVNFMFEGFGTQMIKSLHPFKLVQYSPNPPIADFGIRVCRYPKSMTSTRLIPGMQEGRSSLLGWTKRSLSRLDDPTFTYELIFGFPTKIQMDNPTPIPLQLVVIPNWETTSEIIQNVPQQFKLLSMKVLLVTCTKVMTKSGREKCYTRPVDLCISKALDRLQKEVLIPCDSDWDPIDIGEMTNLRVGLRQFGFHTMSTGEKCTPSFRTYNMTVTHRLQWKIEAKVAGQTVTIEGQANVLVLRSSDEREHSTQGQDAYEIGRSLDMGVGSSEVEEDESWIRPPPENDAPPSFADATVMDRIIETRR